MNHESPLRTDFQDKLGALNADLVRMGELVANAMGQATIALLEAQPDRAERVILGDAEINELNGSVEQHCIALIALQAPVASDLRVVIGSLRIAASLERMGDLAVHIAKQAQMRAPEHAVPTELAPIFEEMGSLGQQVTRRAVKLVETREIDAVASMEEMDSEVDRLHQQIFEVLDSPTWTQSAKTTVDVTLLSRYYERFSDHAVSVARRVVSIVTGAAYSDITLK